MLEVVYELTHLGSRVLAHNHSLNILKVLYFIYHSECRPRIMKSGAQCKNIKEIQQSIIKEGDKGEVRKI